MTPQTGASAPWRASAAQVAGELRAAAGALVGRDLANADLAEALRLARRLREQLVGERRSRWYDAEADPYALSERSRRAYLEQSPIRGELNPVAPPLAIEVLEDADGRRTLEGRVRLGLAYEGPPRGVHGGWVAALFDDVLGASQRLIRTSGVTARLEVRYRHVTPLDEELRLRAWIERDAGRRIFARATCQAGELLTAEATGIFVRVDFNEVHEQMRQRGRQEPG
jgi:acyl-coenzyme A thioesterase PaaI-like protein